MLGGCPTDAAHAADPGLNGEDLKNAYQRKIIKAADKGPP